MSLLLACCCLLIALLAAFGAWRKARRARSTPDTPERAGGQYSRREVLPERSPERPVFQSAHLEPEALSAWAEELGLEGSLEVLPGGVVVAQRHEERVPGLRLDPLLRLRINLSLPGRGKVLGDRLRARVAEHDLQRRRAAFLLRHRPDLFNRWRRSEGLPILWLAGLDLSGANLEGLDFRECVLAGANFRGANLGGADLSTADLWDNDFHGAFLTGVKWPGDYDPPTP